MMGTARLGQSYEFGYRDGLYSRSARGMANDDYIMGFHDGTGDRLTLYTNLGIPGPGQLGGPDWGLFVELAPLGTCITKGDYGWYVDPLHQLMRTGPRAFHSKLLRRSYGAISAETIWAENVCELDILQPI